MALLDLGGSLVSSNLEFRSILCQAGTPAEEVAAI